MCLFRWFMVQNIIAIGKNESFGSLSIWLLLLLLKRFKRHQVLQICSLICKSYLFCSFFPLSLFLSVDFSVISQFSCPNSCPHYLTNSYRILIDDSIDSCGGAIFVYLYMFNVTMSLLNLEVANQSEHYLRCNDSIGI